GGRIDRRTCGDGWRDRRALHRHLRRTDAAADRQLRRRIHHGRFELSRRHRADSCAGAAPDACDGESMKIVDAKVIVCSPGRNFVTLKIVTEDGIYGLGDATLNGRELAVASYLSDHIVPLLIGRDARRIEDTWQYLYTGAYWRRGPVTMTAISAVDTALWDIQGKTLGAPVYQLLGGRSREAVLVYGHANGADIDEAASAVADYVRLGYHAIRVQSGVPGLESTYGVGRGKLHYEPAERGLPPENRWNTDRYLTFVPTLFDRLRRDF